MLCTQNAPRLRSPLQGFVCMLDRILQSQVAHRRVNESLHAPAARQIFQPTVQSYGCLQLDMRSLEAQTSSYEYDVLVDVISGLFIAPLAEPTVMRRHVPPSPVDADDSLVALKAALRPSRQEMRHRQHTLASLTSCAP